jgi:hypothetical protein
MPIVLYHVLEKPLIHVGAALADSLVHQREAPVALSEGAQVAQ